MRISAVEARRHFGELLNRVLLTDEEIIIERAGREVAKLVKMGAAEDKPCEREGKLDFRSARGLGKHVWKDIDPAEYVNRERSRWD